MQLQEDAAPKDPERGDSKNQIPKENSNSFLHFLASSDHQSRLHTLWI